MKQVKDPGGDKSPERHLAKKEEEKKDLTHVELPAVQATYESASSQKSAFTEFFKD